MYSSAYSPTTTLSLLFFLLLCTSVRAQECFNPVAQTDLDVNAVRARLQTSGNLWGSGFDSGYDVTAEADSPNGNPVSAIYTGALWMGGEAVDGRFVRAPAYGAVRGEYGYQTGPLINGQSSRENCINWDRFFTVTGEERRQLISYYTIARQNGDLPIPTNLISDNLLGWPATGNPHFLGANGFNLPETTDGLAPFFDQDQDGRYDPAFGDYPLFCGEEATWCVFNTANTDGDGVAGEALFQIELMAYAFELDNPDLRRTTFYDYTIKYRGEEALFDYYVGHFVDSDLGCYQNDRADSAPEQSLFYVYNDQPTEGSCPDGDLGYGQSAPVNVFQVLGSRITDPNGVVEDSMGMQQYNTFYSSPFVAATGAARTTDEAYNLLSGKWRDGTPITRGGNGYNLRSNDETRFAFDGGSVAGTDWRSCSAAVGGADIRNIYSIGPRTVDPGYSIRFSLAVTTLFGVAYDRGCPDRASILSRADAIRGIYNNSCPREVLLTNTKPEPAKAVALDVFPNPVNNLLTFRLPTGEHADHIDLLDVTGRIVVSKNPDSRQFSLNIASRALPPGTYLYRLYTVSDRLITGKVVVRP